MATYQLRLRKDQRLQDFVESMVKEIWVVAAGYLDPLKIQPGDFRRFENETSIALQPFIGAYDLCGSFCECSDEVEGAPWLDYDDRIYHLSVPGTFAEFIEQLSFTSLDSIRHLTTPKFGELAYETIQEVFRRNLAQHLYYNPGCRRMAVCKDSLPVHPGMN